jgi:hypothetical protein
MAVKSGSKTESLEVDEKVKLEEEGKCGQRWKW